MGSFFIFCLFYYYLSDKLAISTSPEWWDVVYRSDSSLFVLLFFTLVCCQPTKLILGFVFLCHIFSNFTPQLGRNRTLQNQWKMTLFRLYSLTLETPQVGSLYDIRDFSSTLFFHFEHFHFNFCQLIKLIARRPNNSGVIRVNKAQYDEGFFAAFFVFFFFCCCLFFLKFFNLMMECDAAEVTGLGFFVLFCYQPSCVYSVRG